MYVRVASDCEQDDFVWKLIVQVGTMQAPKQTKQERRAAKRASCPAVQENHQMSMCVPCVRDRLILTTSEQGVEIVTTHMRTTRRICETRGAKQTSSA